MKSIGQMYRSAAPRAGRLVQHLGDLEALVKPRKRSAGKVGLQVCKPPTRAPELKSRMMVGRMVRNDETVRVGDEELFISDLPLIRRPRSQQVPDEPVVQLVENTTVEQVSDIERPEATGVMDSVYPGQRESLILLATCRHLKISTDEVMGRRQSNRIAGARHVLASLLWTELRYTYGQVARFLGRHHSTVMNSCSRVEACPELQQAKAAVIAELAKLIAKVADKPQAFDIEEYEPCGD
jgi:chromosomal replication initiation ATPase DnaA